MTTAEKVEGAKTFVTYSELLKGDEKGEAQVFCDRLFQAFGHAGYKEAGATLEFRLKKGRARGTSFADLLWRPRVLLEMKKRGEHLGDHFQQAFEYWIHAVPYRPRYVVLCNFDEFWVYDFDRQIDEPIDRVATVDLPRRYTALNFLYPDDPPPDFGNDREAVTRAAADTVARVFSSIVKRGEDRRRAQLFILQTVVAMFSEDIDLLPRGLVHRLLAEAGEGGSTYDLFGGLFRQMNDPTPAPAGRYQNVPYFNGGLFSSVEPIELNRIEAILLASAAQKDWSKVNPAIFGTLFQNSMEAEARHALGAHYTSEADILRVVHPTIVRPWMARIDSASTMNDLLALRKALHDFKVLDPACGSGNFLYVAYRELVRLDIRILNKIADNFSAKEFERRVKALWVIHPSQFYGIERDTFGLELAKVTLMLAKKLAIDDMMQSLERRQISLNEEALPLDNVDPNFVCGDALFEPWPAVDAIIGNPPFQSKNKMLQEYGRAYVNSIRAQYPDIPGRADYCVYWFRRAHDEIKQGGRVGLVGTNTIRQNYSREGGLDYIVTNGGMITEAVSSQVWSGDAVVHVSIVNWVKGDEPGKKRMFLQKGDRRDSEWQIEELDRIPSSLSFEVDVTRVVPLRVNAHPRQCFQGQTHGHDGFILSAEEARREVQRQPEAGEVLFPYMIADDLVGSRKEWRYVIDFGDRSQPESRGYQHLFARVERFVLPDRKTAAEEEAARNREALASDPRAHTTHDHESALEHWWLLFRRRGEMLDAISQLPRYVVCGRITKRPIFEFADSRIHPNDALMVFPFADDYSFGVLQSEFHWLWFINRCSTMKRDPRYTSNSVFNTFPWPQGISEIAAARVAKAARELRTLRSEIRQRHGRTLRQLYREIEVPGKHPLKDAQAALDDVVARAYGAPGDMDRLAFLATQNQELAAAEKAGDDIAGPGLPAEHRDVAHLYSADRVQFPALP